MKYHVEQRQRMIDFLLYHYGHIGRGQITDFFGVSTPTVSWDFAIYLESHPGNMQFDFSTKRYLRLPTFKRAYP